MKKSCRGCALLDVKPDAAGRRVLYKYTVYRCRAPVPDLPALPASVFKYFHGRLPVVERAWMQPDEGTACATFQALPARRKSKTASPG